MRIRFIPAKIFKRLILGIIALLVIGVPLLYLTLLNSKPASASWYDDNWLFRKAVTVTVSSSSSDITNLETLITVDTTGITASLQTNCEDLRFTNQSGKLLPYYAPSCSDNSATNKVWVLLDLVPKNTTTYTLYMYYGNPSATSVSDANRFNLFNGLVGYWNMNEASWAGVAGEVKDSSVNSNNGVRSGDATTTASGKYSYGGTFDGNGDYVSGSNSSLALAASPLSISAWVKTTQSGVVDMIFKNNSSDNDGYELYINSSNFCSGTIRYNNAAQGGATGTTAINDGNWHLCTLTFDQANARMYVDGVLENTGAVSNPTLSPSGGNDFYIGDRTGHLYFTGSLDDVRVYNRALSAGEISQLYSNPGNIASNANATVKPSTSFASEEKAPGPIAYWRFDDPSASSGQVAKDSTSNHNDGTLGATSGSSTDDPTWQTEDQCISGKCLSFDGGDYINTSTSLNPSGAAGWSMSAWINSSNISSNRAINGWWDGSNGIFIQNTDGSVCTGDGLLVLAGDGSDYGCANVTTLNTWVYVTLVYDGTLSGNANRLKMYVNGIQKTLTFSGGGASIPATIPTLTSTTHKIGDIGSLSRFWSGKIDEVKIYPYARTQAQINSDYNSRGSVKGASVNLGGAAPLDGAAPVGYWNFEEGSGITANDLTGNNNSGTLTNSPTWTTGKYGRGVKSVGESNDYVTVADSATLDTADSNLTVSGWVYINGLPASSAKIFVRDTGSAPNRKFQVYLNSNGTLGFLFCVTGTPTWDTDITSTNTLSPGNWYYITATFDSSSGGKLYVNGVSWGTDATFSGTLTSVNASLEISGSSMATANFSINGKIDEVKIYNYARTQKQIVSDMNAGHPSVGSPVGSAVAHYKFDEGQGTTANNSGNGGTSLAGTLTGMSAPATSTSGWTQAGKFGKALIFDGTDDYIDFSNNASLQITSTIAASAWFKADSSGSGSGIVVGKHSATASNWGWDIYYDFDNNQVCMGMSQTGSNWDSKCVNATEDSWHHVTGVFDGSTINVYMDGISNSKSTTLTAIYNTTANATSGGLSASNYFKGTIDEVKIYNYALTSDEVKLDYNRSSSLVLGSLSDNTSAGSVQASSQEYCVPGDSTSCAAPVARWDFEEGSGTSARDTSGNAYTGTWNGTGSHWTSGKYGKAGNFNGTDDYVSITDSMNLGDNDFTVSAWLNMTASGMLISKRDSDSVNIEWNLQATTNPVFTIFPSGGASADVVTSSESIDTGKWYQITAVHDNTNDQIRIYINGRLAGTTTKTKTITDSASPFRIGAVHSTPATFLNGKVDGVRIYNYARSAAQIAWDYNKGAPVGHWKFDECQGDRTNDSSGNGNHGTITIGATGSEDTIGTCNTSSTAWGSGATGKRNASLSFDGTDDYVSMGDVELTNSNQISVSAWAKLGTTQVAYGSIVSKSYDSYAYSLHIDQTDTSKVAFTTTSWTNKAKSNSSLNDSQWHHLVGIYDGATIKLYVDGVLQSQTGTDTANITNTADYLMVGAGGKSGTTNYFINGQIDDAKIFNYALTATQVKTLYNNGAVNFAPLTGSP